MDVLELIKNRRTIRKYTDKKIPDDVLNRIIEAGVWGPSVHTAQPWMFYVVRDPQAIRGIVSLGGDKQEKTPIELKVMLSFSLKIISNASLLIAAYNTRSFSKKINKFGKNYEHITRISEIQAISAAIQNMILIAESYGVGSCWLNMPLFYQEKLNRFFKTDNELIALLTFGYPDEIGHRSKRKKRDEAVCFL